MHQVLDDGLAVGAGSVFEDRYWYLAQLKPGGLERAKLNLLRQGFKCFMPMRESSVRRRGKILALRQPLFPGYVFAQVLPRQQHWHAINGTYGVARLVSLYDSKPTQVPAELMSALYARTDEGGLVAAPDNLKTGDTVRIVSGPFTQSIAEIESVEPDARVVLLMQLMGRTVRAQTTARLLEVL